MKEWRVEMRDSNRQAWTPVYHQVRSRMWSYALEPLERQNYELEYAIHHVAVFHRLHMEAVHRSHPGNSSLGIRFVHINTGEVIPFEALGE